LPILQVNGEETQAPVDNPNAVNFWNYQYKVLSRQLLFENKLLFTFYKRYHPYLLIGLGGSLNHVYGFQVTPENSGEVATAIFESNHNTSFSTTFGLGIDIDVLKKLRVGLGYRFVNLGNYNLGKGTLNTGVGGEIFSIPALKVKNSFNHEILVQLTYLI
jgi:opacity protein-like surface antigen